MIVPSGTKEVFSQYVCPYCGLAQVPTASQKHHSTHLINVTRIPILPAVGVYISAISCANPACNEVSLRVKYGAGKMTEAHFVPATFQLTEKGEEFQLRPPAIFAVQPECVPRVLADDYYEACKIRDLSPKASATLSRRVIQGMIRDFCRIQRGSLFLEIKELEDMSARWEAPQGVQHETIEAMHHVRTIGNIGAHMEKDINIVVDVEPGEAQALIGLVELLFKEWYVARAARLEQLSSIKRIAEAKKEQKRAIPTEIEPPVNEEDAA
jgi:hypothetical protein